MSFHREAPAPGARSLEGGPCLSVDGQRVVIFEIRPQHDAPHEKMEIPLAKATIVRTQNVWKVYWQRADMKWHAYQPTLSVDSVGDFVELVEKDEHSCFFG